MKGKELITHYLYINYSDKSNPSFFFGEKYIFKKETFSLYQVVSGIIRLCCYGKLCSPPTLLTFFQKILPYVFLMQVGD